MSNNSIIKSDVSEIMNSLDLSGLRDKSILITGASGLIGTYLLFVLKNYISSEGRIKSITAVSRNLLPDHLLELTTDENFNFLIGDLTKQSFLDDLGQYDIIIHAAGYGQPQKFMADPLTTIRLNSFTTDILISKVNRNGKFIFLSSSELYMGSLSSPSKVTDIGTTSPSHPRAPYIEGKRIGETIVYSALRDGIDAKIIRLSLLYGPGFKKNDTRVLNEFIFKGINSDIRLLDDGSVSRTYCYISDGIELLLKIMLSGKEILYNVGGHSKISVIEIAELISKQLHSRVITSNIKNKLNAPNSVEVDMTLTDHEFKKSNYIEFKEGLSRTINWFKSNHI